MTKRPGQFLRLLLLLSCVTFFLINSNTAYAISLTEYQDNLRRAITALDTLSQQDEEESDSDYSRRIRETTQAIRTAIPETQMVESGDEIYSVQNSWLHNQLGEIEKASRTNREIHISESVDRLRALDERISEIGKDSRATNSSDAKQKLEGILRRPEYQTEGKGSNAISRLLRDFFRWLESLFPKPSPLRPEQATSLSRTVKFVSVGLCIIVIAYVLKVFLPRLFRKRKTKTKKPEPRIVLGERIAPDQSAGDLLSEAEQLAREGQLRSAIRKAYVALLVELNDRKAISIAQHKTNRDYLDSVRHTPNLYSSFSGLTERFERHWYGFVQAGENDWQEFRSIYLTTLRTDN